MKSKLLKSFLFGATFISIAGCQSVKPFQARLLEDHYMQQNIHEVEKLEAEAESFREGASSGMGGKAGGGCGCN